jgi:hypothetical protein
MPVFLTVVGPIISPPPIGCGVSAACNLLSSTGLNCRAYRIQRYERQQPTDFPFLFHNQFAILTRQLFEVITHKRVRTDLPKMLGVYARVGIYHRVIYKARLNAVQPHHCRQGLLGPVSIGDIVARLTPRSSASR